MLSPSQIMSIKQCKDPKATDELYVLAFGPKYRIISYNACIVNVVQYCIKDRDDKRVTQNYGIWVEGEHDGQSCDFYGLLVNIFQLNYMHDHTVVLFKCQWFDTDVKKRRIHTELHITSINVSSFWYENDPFVLTS